MRTSKPTINRRTKPGQPPKAGRAKPLPVEHPNAAGIDIGSRTHYVAVPPDRAEEPVRHFGALTPDLHRMADFLIQCGVDTVAMESTGVYWIPVCDVLEARGLKVLLVNASQAKNVPGRKSDVLDCQWLQRLHTFGLLRGSFRPPAEVLELRTYLRQRDMLVRGAGEHVQHMHKALTEMNIQVQTVISDLTGETGMAIVRKIVDGERDPERLAALRNPRCRASQATIAASLTGTWRNEHLLALKQALELYNLHLSLIRECDERAKALLDRLAARNPPVEPPPIAGRARKPVGKQPTVEIRAPLYRLTRSDLSQVPGIGPYSALRITSEIGTDMSRWPDAAHFASWLGFPPGTRITGGRVISARTKPCSQPLKALLRTAAVNAGKTDTALGAYYRRFARRKDKGAAVAATAHKMARIIYAMLRDCTEYQDAGSAAFEEQHRQRALRGLRARARGFGFELVAAAASA